MKVIEATDEYRAWKLRPWMNTAAWYVSLSLVFGLYVYSSWSQPGIDFNVYLTAARRFMGAQALYRVGDGAMPFMYAPSAAWLFIPFLYFPERLALFVWNGLSFLAFYATVRKLLLFLKPQLASWPLYPALLAAVVCVLQPFSNVFAAGQVELILLFLMTQSALLADQKEDALSGLALALAVTIKFPCAILGLYFLLQKKYRCLFYTAIAAAIFMAPVIMRYHESATLQLLHNWQLTMASSTPTKVLRFDAQGLPTAILDLFYRNSQFPTAFALMAVQGVLLLLFVMAMLWFRPLPRISFCLCCLAITLLSPMAWVTNFLFGLPALWSFFLTPMPRWMKYAFLIPGALLNGFVHSSIIGEALSTRIMFLRPYALLFFLVWVVLLWKNNRFFRGPIYR